MTVTPDITPAYQPPVYLTCCPADPDEPIFFIHSAETRVVPHPLTDESVPIRNTHLERTRGDRVVLFLATPLQLQRFQLDATLSQVWRLVDGERSIAGIIALCPDLDPEKVRSVIASLNRAWLVLLEPVQPHTFVAGSH